MITKKSPLISGLQKQPQQGCAGHYRDFMSSFSCLPSLPTRVQRIKETHGISVYPTLHLLQDLPGNSSAPPEKLQSHMRGMQMKDLEKKKKKLPGVSAAEAPGPQLSWRDQRTLGSRQWPPQTNLSPVSTDREASSGGKFPGHVNNFHSHSPSLCALVCVGSAMGPFRSRAHRPPSAAQIPLTNKRRQFLRRYAPRPCA